MLYNHLLYRYSSFVTRPLLRSNPHLLLIISVGSVSPTWKTKEEETLYPNYKIQVDVRTRCKFSCHRTVRELGTTLRLSVLLDLEQEWNNKLTSATPLYYRKIKKKNFLIRNVKSYKVTGYHVSKVHIKERMVCRFIRTFGLFTWHK